MSGHFGVNRLIHLAAERLETKALPIDELSAAILDEHPNAAMDATDLAHQISDSGYFSVASDDRVIYLPAMLDGTTWAATISESDAAHESLPSEAFTSLSRLLLERDVTLVDDHGEPTGAHIRWEEVELGNHLDEWVEDRFTGPDGWLDGGAGSAVALTFGPECTAILTKLGTAPRSTPEIDAAFNTAYHHVAFEDPESPGEYYAATDEVLDQLLAANRDLLLDCTVPPVEVLAAGGDFEIHAHLIAPAGFDWERLDRRFSKRRRRLGWNLSEHADAMLDHLLRSVEATAAGQLFAVPDSDDDRPLADTLATALGLPNLARAFVAEVKIPDAHDDDGTALETDDRPDTAAALQLLRAVLQLTDHPAGGAAVAAAMLLDFSGQALGALDILERAEAAGTDHPDALERLAGFRSDQGDAPAAMKLLGRAGVFFDGVDPDDLEAHPLFMEIVDFATHRPPVDAGRNDPCPCGSGKKYKKCHIGKERHRLADRAGWLYSKATRFTRENRFRGGVAELAFEMNDAAGGHHVDYLRFIETPLVSDLVLAEGGAGVAFAAERDVLLPDDEALIAAQWSLVERSLFEVEATSPDTLDLRDLRTGDRLTIRNTTPAPTTRPGSLLLGRAFPVGDTWRGFAGFVPISEHRVDETLAALDEGDPVWLARLIGSTFAPPQLTNTSGDPMQFHSLTWTVPDVGEVGAAMAAAGLQSDGGDRWTLVRDTNQPDTVIASFAVDDGELTAECNSDRRADEVIALVAQHLPGATLVDDDVRNLDEVVNSEDFEHGPESGPSAAMDSQEMREVVAKMVERYESEWLDESVPALDGMTPRECAAHPIAREKLVRLLATFPAGDDPTQMSAKRLGAALGLDR